MKPYRFNGFWLIHKGLRCMLYETGLQLNKTDFADPKAVASLSAQINDLLKAYEHHASIENNYILPLIQAQDPAMIEAFESEHDQDHELGETLAGHLNEVLTLEAGEAHAAAVKSLHYAFYAFMAFNLEHMNREELVLNEVLWKYYTDAEIMNVIRQLQMTMDPEAKALMDPWIMKGANQVEIQMILQAAS
jgi:hemerythrin-like domain-containing protein